MDDAQKQMLKAELTAVRSIISASAAPASSLNQTTVPVTGPTVNIPALAIAAQVFRQQAEAMDKLAGLVEKVINAA